MKSKVSNIPTEKSIPIHKMGAGEVFYFTSAKSKTNTGYYLKQNSKAHKAMNLQTFKMFDFSSSADLGIPVTAEFNIITKKTK
jgi:hypothetical protein